MIAYRCKIKEIDTKIFLVMRTLRIFSLNHFVIHYTAVLIIFIILYTTSLVIIYVMYGSLYLLIAFIQFFLP